LVIEKIQVILSKENKLFNKINKELSNSCTNIFIKGKNEI